jgi:hypothetical protein
MKTNKEQTKQERIDAEIKRLNAIYRNVPKREKSIIEGLIKRAAYMRVTLEDYEVDLDAGGYVEKFQQSEKVDPYERERPVARLYNTMNKNYQSIIKQLGDLVPKEIPKTEDDAFDEFIKKR